MPDTPVGRPNLDALYRDHMAYTHMADWSSCTLAEHDAALIHAYPGLELEIARLRTLVKAALNALEMAVSPADLEAMDISVQSVVRHAEGKDVEIRALQARLDEATMLIRQAAEDMHADSEVLSGVGAPYLAWLAGNKEAGNE